MAGWHPRIASIVGHKHPGDDVSTDSLSGSVLDGRYEILARLARGGMATVYRAWDRRLERIVAIKVMHEGLGDDIDFAARFDREARSAAKLTSPNVVAIYDQGTEQGRPYIVMEFVEGSTLRNLIAKQAPVSPLRALQLIEPVASALAAAHTQGLVHRDVKPENVLISERGEIKVADFGLARSVTTQSATATQGMLIGTVSYLPPELLISGKADARSDVYSLGIVLYELLTGTKPFTADSAISVAYAHVRQDVPPPSQTLKKADPATARHHAIPDYVDALVLACTRRDPAQRPRDGLAVLTRIRRARRAIEQGVVNDETLAAIMHPLAGEPSNWPGTQRIPVGDTRATPSQAAAALTQADTDPHTEHDLPAVEPVPAPKKPKSAAYKRRRTIFAAVLAVLVMVIGVGTWWFTSGRFIPAPNLVGVDQDTASQIAADAGLTVTFTEDYSEDVAAGLVISTDPPPDAKVERSGTMRAVLSKGPERYPMPDIYGKTIDEARPLLEQNHLKLGEVTEVYHDTAPERTIVETSVGAGEMVPRDTVVDVTISKGREPITVPNVVGKTITEAEKTLSDLGLTTEVTREFSTEKAKDEVISQSPAATETAYAGDAVALKVSDGPQKIEMPDVEDKPVDEAKQILEDAGLVVDEIKYPFGTRNRKVLWTDPGKGKLVDKGSKVTITAR